MVVDLKNVKYTYDRNTISEKAAVAGVSLQIQKGECVFILGKTGCGKSTLLSLISGTLKPQEGSVYIDCPASMMFQNPEKQLFAQTVLDDVMYGPMNLGQKPDEAKKSAVRALNMVGFDELQFDKDPTALSFGQKRKAALAGILAMNRDLLIIDEPTSGLDSESSRQIMNTIEQLNKTGVTVVIATHDCNLAINYADRVIIMDEGKIVFDDVPEKMLDEIEQVKQFGIDVPEIAVISNMLYREGLLTEKNLCTARDILSHLK